MRSTGFRFFVVGCLALLMFIPQFFAAAIVQDRSYYAKQVSREIGQEWGGSQTLTGPFMVIPVEATETRTAYRTLDDPETGEPKREAYDEEVIVRRMPVVLLPETFDAILNTAADIRKRGIFEVPVYTADVGLTAIFDPTRTSEALLDGERLVWDEAVLRLALSGNAGLRGTTTIEGPDGPLDLKPFAAERRGGIEALTGRLSTTTTFTADFTLNGSQQVNVVPVGRDTQVRMAGDWADPSFRGAFLPDAHEVTETGYTAEWSVPHLARTLPQVSRQDGGVPGEHAFGTAFIQVNDFYQRAWRAGRYGILFIALTFLTVLLMDRKDRPAHPVQYVLIGLAQSTFVLLMVAYAEQFGFTVAYVGSAAATIALLTLLGWSGLRMGRRTFALTGILTVLYGVLYLILQSTDLALIAGATLVFAALALTIVLTRNEDWYGAGGPGHGLRRKPRTSVPPVAQAKADAPAQANADSNAISTMSPKDD